jgi:hypothetical protein
MPLISRWVKDRFTATATVYIPRESAVTEISRASYCPDHLRMPSYKLGGSRSEPNSPERGGDQTSPVSIRLPAFARYNLWPKPKKQSSMEPTTPESVIPPPVHERSPSSLSETAVHVPRRLQRAPNRSGNLAIRRKISVPELREKPPPDAFDELTPLGPLLDSRMYNFRELLDISDIL